MSFRSVFLAVVIAFALIVSAFLINRQRPSVETAQPTADFVHTTGHILTKRRPRRLNLVTVPWPHLRGLHRDLLVHGT